MGKRGSGGGGGGSRGAAMNSGRELKTFLRNRMWREHWYVLVAVAGVSIALFGAAIFQFSTSRDHIFRIDVGNAAMMQRVFQSGEPWVVLCSKPDDAMPDVFSDASKRLTNKSFVGVLDCTQRLPVSGKTVFARFRLRKIYPTVFTVANGQKPKQVPLEFLQSAKALGRRVQEQNKKQAVEIITPKQLTTKCLDRKTCVLILRGRKHDAYERQWLGRLMAAHRTLQFATIDATRWKLSIEGRLPDLVEGEHRLVLFKKQKQDGDKAVLGVKAYRNAFELLPVQQFLEDNLDAELKAVAEVPVLSKRKSAKTTEKPRARASRRRGRKRPDTKTDSTNAKKPAGADDWAESVDDAQDEPVRHRADEEEEEEVLDLDAMDDEV